MFQDVRIQLFAKTRRKTTLACPAVLAAIPRPALSVGFTIKSIFEEYPNGEHEKAPDPSWIKMCAENDWVAISGDKRIKTNPIEKQAIIDSKLKVFILTDSNSLPEEWAAAVIVGSEKIQSVVRKNEGMKALFMRWSVSDPITTLAMRNSSSKSTQMTKQKKNKMTSKPTQERSLTLAPVKFEDAIKAALETKPEKHQKKKPTKK